MRSRSTRAIRQRSFRKLSGRTIPKPKPKVIFDLETTSEPWAIRSEASLNASAAIAAAAGIMLRNLFSRKD